MFDDFAKALGQIGDPKFRSVLLRGIGLTVLLLAGVTTGVQFLLPESVSLPWFGEIGWLSTLLSGFVLVAMIGLSVILMVPVASLFTGFFLDQVMDAVEAKHFPALEPASSVSFTETLMDALGFFGLLVVVNLLALVIYLLSTLAAPLVFWAVNGVMLGREYFQMVAMRRLGRAGAKQLRARHRGQIWLAGALMAIPLTVPIVNLVIPVLGVATFTHLFHRVNKTGKPVL
ncbi:EI24 domain-containing protein [Neptunicoccus sediminis]|uniref:EI24 domain-containing protein n=1 Tax=Neptunicoccus sediminis TaxID=1892596 RepID=UPI000D5263EC|nr:EI24 domain-containing protein [Neptunicoccus sediminis]